jgi:hypothetical protein
LQQCGIFSFSFLLPEIETNKIWLYLILYFTGVFALIGVVIFGVSATYKDNLHFSFAFCVIGGVAGIIAGAVLAVEKCNFYIRTLFHLWYSHWFFISCNVCLEVIHIDTYTCFIQKIYAPSSSLLQGKHLPFSPSTLRFNIFGLFVIFSLTQLYRYTTEIFLFSTATFKYTYRATLRRIGQEYSTKIASLTFQSWKRIQSLPLCAGFFICIRNSLDWPCVTMPSWSSLLKCKVSL